MVRVYISGVASYINLQREKCNYGLTTNTKGLELAVFPRDLVVKTEILICGHGRTNKCDLQWELMNMSRCRREPKIRYPR
jgi:hypothetical protein